MLEIEALTALTDAQRAEILALQSASLAPEGLQNEAWLSSEINFDRAVPCFFLGRENGALTSFLTLFLPTRLEGEVIAFTHPSARRKGQFTALLQRAGAVLKRCAVPRFLFAAEPQSAGACAVLERLPQAAWTHTEYRMRLEAPHHAPLKRGLSCVRVTAERLEDFVAISRREYGDRAAVLAVVESGIRTPYLLLKGAKPVGVFELAREADGSRALCGVSVPPQLRGRGYGDALVCAALNVAAAENAPIQLDVDSDNPVALHLYRKHGFAPTFEVRYFACPVEAALEGLTKS